MSWRAKSLFLVVLVSLTVLIPSLSVTSSAEGRNTFRKLVPRAPQNPTHLPESPRTRAAARFIPSKKTRNTLKGCAKALTFGGFTAGVGFAGALVMYVEEQEDHKENPQYWDTNSEAFVGALGGAGAIIAVGGCGGKILTNQILGWGGHEATN